MKQKSVFMGLLAILSLTMTLTPTLIDDALALKSAGNPLHKYGSATDNTNNKWKDKVVAVTPNIIPSYLPPHT